MGNFASLTARAENKQELDEIIKLLGLKINKSWMKLSSTSVKYTQGIDEFLDYAYAKASQDNKILCFVKSVLIFIEIEILNM